MRNIILTAFEQSVLWRRYFRISASSRRCIGTGNNWYSQRSPLPFGEVLGKCDNNVLNWVYTHCPFARFVRDWLERENKLGKEKRTHEEKNGIYFVGNSNRLLRQTFIRLWKSLEIISPTKPLRARSRWDNSRRSKETRDPSSALDAVRCKWRRLFSPLQSSFARSRSRTVYTIRKSTRDEPHI